MTHVQTHRGPDDSGLWDRKFPDGSYLGLGSRRLAILDLSSSGHMPMCNEDRTLWITYNGEVYNFGELRRGLENKGHRFNSNTDTEVILHLYEQEGPDCVKRLNGMFAFAICDLRKTAPELFLARDHFGIKPLYYYHEGNHFAFASEVKAVLQVPGIRAELDPRSLHQYLTFLWVPEPKTMFRRISKLPAGHYAIFRDGKFNLTQYWDLEFPPANQTYWLANDLQSIVDDLLSSSHLRKRGLFKPESVRRLVDEHRCGRHDWSMQLWQFLTLELWMQMFLDGGAKRFETETVIPMQAATA